MGMALRVTTAPPDRRPTTVLAIAASAGGFEPLKEIVERLPSDAGLSVLVVMHLSRSGPSSLAQVLGRVSLYEASQAVDAEPLESNHVYVAPPNYHLTVRDGHVRLTLGPRENRVRPSADPLFRSIARSYGLLAVGLVLSGMQNDGANGLAEIHRRGGLALVQDPGEAQFPPMPEAAIRADEPKVLSAPEEIVQAIEEAALENIRDRASRLSHDVGGTMNDNEADNDAAEADEASQAGELTGLKCPDCGGSLWHRNEKGNSSYRCRVGHALSAESLDEAQVDILESTLWEAVVRIEERAEFIRQLQVDETQSSYQRWSEDLEELEVQAARLREVIETVLSMQPATESEA